MDSIIFGNDLYIISCAGKIIAVFSTKAQVQAFVTGVLWQLDSPLLTVTYAGQVITDSLCLGGAK